MKFKNFEVDIRMTDADVLERYEVMQNGITSVLNDELSKAKTASQLACGIRKIGSHVRTFVEECGGDYDKMFPKADIMDYFAFYKALSEQIKSTNLKSMIEQL